MTDREEFLAGERPEDVLMYFAEDAVSGADALADTRTGERVETGVVIVVDGEEGRGAFQSVTGHDPMQFAQGAMGTEGTVDANCTGGTCPNAADDGSDEPHVARFVFAFAEEQNEEVGDLYAEGDVVHAYVSCSCGTAYSDKWVVGERS
jgi:hypothetical protein